MTDSRNKLLSVVIPAFNEAAAIQATIRTLADVCAALSYAYEIIVVDDGSRDDTFDRAAQLVDAGLPVRALRLSRNFGKEAALLAGLQNARGDAVITIDADLQHPPSLIPRMVDAWKRGAKVVHGVKRDRGDERWWVTARANIINRMLKTFGGVDVRNSSDFKLLDRVAVNVLTRYLPERRRFYRGLADWIGFPQATLEFDVAPRRHGKSSWSIRSLVALALTATISFTSAPLRIVSILGVVTLLLGIGVGSDALWSWFHGGAVSGFLTLITTLLLLGSFIMISLGVIGEYIAKIDDETKQRPPFIIDGVHETPNLTAAAEVAVPLTKDNLARSRMHSWLSSELLEFTQDAIIIWEMDGAGILYWNQAAEQLYGYTRDAVYGETTHALLNTQVAGGTNELEAKIARFGVWVGKLMHRTRDGRLVVVEGRLALLAQRGGRWLVLEVNRDITDHAAAEVMRKSTEKQLASLRARATSIADDEADVTPTARE